MAILNFSVCKGHAWFWSSRLCLSSFSGHCCEASAVKSASDGQRRVMFFHIMSCKNLSNAAWASYICSLSFFNNFCPVGKVPNRRDHGSLSQNRPRIVRQQFISLEKKHFYTRCAGLSVYALLTLCSPDCPFEASQEDGGHEGEEAKGELPGQSWLALWGQPRGWRPPRWRGQGWVTWAVLNSSVKPDKSMETTRVNRPTASGETSLSPAPATPLPVSNLSTLFLPSTYRENCWLPDR